MISAQLFLGFPVTSEYERLLGKVKKEMLCLFIQEDSEYLQNIQYEGVRYIGKR